MALVENMKELMTIYDEIYFQGRILEELEKDDNIYQKLPIIPPKPDTSAQVIAWCIFLLLSGATLYLLFADTLWFLATAAMGFITFMIAVSISDSDSSLSRQREWALKEYAAIKEQNAKRKSSYPEIRRILNLLAREYSQAKETSEKMAAEACDILQLPHKYRNYPNVCSLYQYLYTDTGSTLAQACNRLDKAILTGNYVSSPMQALERAEQVKFLQPVWMERLPRQEKMVSPSIKYLCNSAAQIARNNRDKMLSGDLLEYELTKQVAILLNGSTDYDVEHGKLLWESSYSANLAHSRIY